MLHHPYNDPIERVDRDKTESCRNMDYKPQDLGRVGRNTTAEILFSRGSINTFSTLRAPPKRKDIQ
jgi:hypothetical protein